MVFIYLITNEKVNICGIYELPDKYIRFDLDLKQTELDKIKQKFMKDNKFLFIDGWIKITNYDIYNRFVGEKNEKAKENELALIPIEIREFRYPIDRVSSKGDTLNNKLVINNSISNQNKKEQIINYLNDKANKGYLPKTLLTVKLIDARLKEGYSLDDFKRVIDIKVEEWKDKYSKDGKNWGDYLRPQTLFGNKFESYLNQNSEGSDPNRFDFIDEEEKQIE